MGVQPSKIKTNVLVAAFPICIQVRKEDITGAVITEAWFSTWYLPFLFSLMICIGIRLTGTGGGAWMLKGKAILTFCKKYIATEKITLPGKNDCFFLRSWTYSYDKINDCPFVVQAFPDGALQMSPAILSIKGERVQSSPLQWERHFTKTPRIWVNQNSAQKCIL